MRKRKRSNPVHCLVLSGMIALLCACDGLQVQAHAGNVYDQPLEVRHVTLNVTGNLKLS